MTNRTYNITAGLLLTSAIPSIISCTMIIGSHFYYAELKVIEFRMIVYMQLGDLITTTCMFISSIWYFELKIEVFFLR